MSLAALREELELAIETMKEIRENAEKELAPIQAVVDRLKIHISYFEPMQEAYETLITKIRGKANEGKEQYEEALQSFEKETGFSSSLNEAVQAIDQEGSPLAASG